MDDIPQNARELFARSATDLDATALAALRADVSAHLGAFREAAKRLELLPLDVAEQIASGLLSLFDGYASLPPDHRKLVAGAARYFVSHEDARPDLSGVLGLDDDAAVFNHVARAIGRLDLIVDP